MASSRILVSGASGLIGSALLPSLAAREYAATKLTRQAFSPSDDQISWDPARPLPPQCVSGFDYVVHLAGKSIVGRWTNRKKILIRDSRVLGTAHLAHALAQASQRPRVLVCASAIGYYGDRGEEVLREEAPPGRGFLPSVCQQWEAAAQPAADAGIRVVHLRFGIVLSAAGGALKQMLLPFRLGLGGNVGNGHQWWSWVHIADVVGAIHYALVNNSMRGPVNVVAPNPVTNSQFTSTLGAVLVRPTMFPMPAFAARTAFGQMADELLLSSQRVEPAKLLGAGYSFEYSELRAALQQILRSRQ